MAENNSINTPLEHLDTITTNIAKAKALVDLMAASTHDTSLDHQEEVRWGEMIVRDLLDKASEEAHALFAIADANCREA